MMKATERIHAKYRQSSARFPQSLVPAPPPMPQVGHYPSTHATWIDAQLTLAGGTDLGILLSFWGPFEG